MWPRVSELFFGLWLAVSPFIFKQSHPDGWWQSHPDWLWNDAILATIIIVIALASYWRPLRRIHLLQLAAGLWLIAWGYFSGPTPDPHAGVFPPPTLQNDIFVGLLLLTFGIIPSECTYPPPRWEDFQRQRQAAAE